MEGGGMPYLNTKAHFAELGEACRDARLLDLVPYSRIDDQRNDVPVEYLPNWSDSDSADASVSIKADSISIEAEPVETIDGQPATLIRGDHLLRPLQVLGLSNAPDPIGMPAAIEAPALPAFDAETGEVTPAVTVRPPSIAPPWFHVEQWCEKTTVNDVLLTVARERRLNVITGPGFQSHTNAWRLLERAKRSRRPVRILYISDFDVGGRHMPLSVARVVEFLNRRDRLGLDIQLIPIALTYEQCVQYELPRTMIKDTVAGKGDFERRFGEGATELDALEALRPGGLRQIILEELERYRDPTFADRMREAQERTQEKVDRVHSEVIAPYREQLDSLDAAPREIIERRNEGVRSFLKVRHTALNARVEEIAADRVASINERIEAIQDEVASIDEEITELYAPRLIPLNAAIEQLRSEVEALNAEVRRIGAEGIEEINAGIRERNERCEAEISELNERIERIQGTIRGLLEPAVGPVLEQAEWPGPEEQETGLIPLFDSKRGYLEQLEIYKAYQAKPTTGAIAIKRAIRAAERATVMAPLRERLAERQRKLAERAPKPQDPQGSTVDQVKVVGRQ
jgi:hypothetical protein